MPVKIIIDKKVDIHKLVAEFATAGFLQTSSRENEFITVEDSNDATAVKAVYDAHNSTSKTWDEIKAKRNELLSACDWTQLTDAVLTLDEKTAWQDYRQTLRDIPQDYASPDDVIIPTPPNEVS